jgi:hypothetical protein
VRPRFLKVERSQFRNCRSGANVRQREQIATLRAIVATENAARLQIRRAITSRCSSGLGPCAAADH